MAANLIGNDECCHCGKVLLKYMMFLFNLLISLSGAALLGLGVFLYVSNGMSNAADAGISLTLYYNGCYAFMGLGGVMMIMGAMGCCGAINNSTFLLKTFIAILSLIIVAEIGLVIFVAVDKDEIKNMVKENWNTTLADKGDNDPFVQGVENLQQELQCCGLLNGCTDWKDGVTHNCGCIPDQSNNRTCVSLATVTGCTSADASDQYIYQDACANSVVDYVRDNLVLFLGITAGVVLFEIVAVIVACCVHRHAEYSKYDALA